jgi:hypothetical protein
MPLSRIFYSFIVQSLYLLSTMRMKKGCMVPCSFLFSLHIILENQRVVAFFGEAYRVDFRDDIGLWEHLCDDKLTAEIDACRLSVLAHHGRHAE